MKSRVIPIMLSLALVALITVPVMAAAQKVNLVACPINYPSGLSGGGFVIFNNSAGPNNLVMTVSLKGAAPNTTFDIYLGVDTWGSPGKVGSVTTNKQGNGNFHLNTAVERRRTHTLNVDITLEGSGADVYELPGIHDSPMGGATLTFKK